MRQSTTIFEAICHPVIRRKKTKFKEVESRDCLNVLGHNAQGVGYGYMKQHLQTLDAHFQWGIILGVEFLVGDKNNLQWKGESINDHLYFSAPSTGGSHRMPAVVINSRLRDFILHEDKLEPVYRDQGKMVALKVPTSFGKFWCISAHLPPTGSVELYRKSLTELSRLLEDKPKGCETICFVDANSVIVPAMHQDIWQGCHDKEKKQPFSWKLALKH